MPARLLLIVPVVCILELRTVSVVKHTNHESHEVEMCLIHGPAAN